MNLSAPALFRYSSSHWLILSACCHSGDLTIAPSVWSQNATCAAVSAVGPTSERQFEETALTPKSFHVGTAAASPSRRFGAATAIARNLPLCTCLKAEPGVAMS